MPYREALYDAYVGSHVDPARGITRQALDRAMPGLRARFLRYLPADREARVLDAGCGYGALVAMLRGAGYRHVVGVDRSAEQVDLARRLAIAGVEHGDLFAYLEAPGPTFDCILLLDVLEHCTKDEALSLVRAVRARLVPGGRAVIHTANAAGPFGAEYRYADLTHELAFTDQSIGQLLRVCGFEGIEVHEDRPVVYGLKSAVRAALWPMVRAVFLAALVVESGSTRPRVLTQNLIAVARTPGGRP